jgi:hypothetical protein
MIIVDKNHRKVVFLFAVFVLNLQVFAGTRQPSVAGSFYPADPKELTAFIKGYLSEVPATKLKRGETIVGLIVPHAGYVYSGPVAAYGYKLLENAEFDTVILLGQSHHFQHSKSAVSPDEKFRTPLGDVPVDTVLAGALVSEAPGLFEYNSAPHLKEHTLEVQLPFLQVLLKRFKILPILVPGEHQADFEKTAIEIVSALRKAGGRKAVFVISSDMSHYPSYSDAYTTDREILQTLKLFDPVKLSAKYEELMAREVKNQQCLL